MSYQDIGGIGRIVARVREMIEMPMRHPDVFDRLGIDAPRGVLLYGSPGCGKTLLARAIADETDAHFICVNGPEIIHKLYGDSEAHLRAIFEEAQAKTPCIIFLDEIDAIAPNRANVKGEVEKRVVAQLLALMDGLKSRGQVIIIGATNIPDNLDPALLRPGRFDIHIHVDPPDAAARQEILAVHTRKQPLAADVDLASLGAETEGCSGADLAGICCEAGMIAIRRLIKQTPEGHHDLSKLTITQEDMYTALARNIGRSSTGADMTLLTDVTAAS